MARWAVESWVVEEHDSSIMRRVNQTSVVESTARRVPMATDSKVIPRSSEVDVDIIPKGTAYGEDNSAVDEITLIAKKFGKAIRIAEEDIDDSFANLLEDRKLGWARSYAIALDNACLGTTDAVDTDTPFVSVYRAVTQADSGAGYTANANLYFGGKALGSGTFTDTGDIVTFATAHTLAVNDRVIFGTVTTTTGVSAKTPYYVKTAPSGTTVTLSTTPGGATLALTTDGTFTGAQKTSDTTGTASYDNLSSLLATQESGQFYDRGRMGFIADPSWQANLRNIKDTNGRPIQDMGLNGTQENIFGYPIKYTLGARTSTAATQSPTGDPLLIFGNMDHLILGVRSGPETVVIDGRAGLSALTDETILKCRSRRGFGVGFPQAFSVLQGAPGA